MEMQWFRTDKYIMGARQVINGFVTEELSDFFMPYGGFYLMPFAGIRLSYFDVNFGLKYRVTGSGDESLNERFKGYSGVKFIMSLSYRFSYQKKDKRHF